VPQTVDEIVDFVAGKILESLGFWEEASRVLKEWSGENRKGDDADK
jgi:3-polyprenyl-4-hydroxybenzoate decarboxylase